MRKALALACAAALAGAGLLAAGERRSGAAADAEDGRLTHAGRLVYAAHCAGCHGRALQGQPLWEVRDAYTRRRAPALDQSGPAWRKSDAELIGMVSAGSPVAADGTRGGMPAFAGTLDEGQIRAVTAFVKGRWPIGMRVAQAGLSGGAGAPREAAGQVWTFPPDCKPAR